MLFVLVYMSLNGCADSAAVPAIHLPTETPDIILTPSPIPAIAANTNYYVSPEGRDDSGDGSATLPWATINHAAAVVPNGALILVKPGLYEGQIALTRQLEQGITIRSERP